MTIAGLYRKVEALDTDSVAINSVEDTKEVLADFNRSQMFDGVKSDGSQIIPPYTPWTVSLKMLKGQPYDRVTLKDTGDFQKAVRVEVRNDVIVTDSQDYKSEKLKEKYGEQIFGLSKDYQSIYVRGSLRPSFKEKIEALIGLIMR